MRWWLAPVSLLLAASAAGALGQPRDPPGDAAGPAESLPAEVATVQTLGWWSEGGREGPYRLVITEHGFDKIVSRIYVQWIQRPDEQTPARVVSSIGFDELNEVPLYSLQIGAVRTLPDALEVELEASSLYTGEERRFLLRAGPPASAVLRAQP